MRSSIPTAGWQLALVWVVVLAAVHAAHDSVGTLEADDDFAAKKLVVQLWTHVDGSPTGHAVELDLPDGQSEDVQEIVAAKEAERAAAELHHARVKETQKGQIKDEAAEATRASATKAAIADAKYTSVKKAVKDGQMEVAKAEDASSKAAMKFAEKSQAFQFASAKKKAKLQGDVELAKKTKAATATQLDNLKDKVKQLEEELTDVTDARDEADNKAGQDRLQSVGAAARYRAAKDQTERLAFEKLKAQQTAKLSVEMRSRENWKKKVKTAQGDVTRAKEYLKMMDSEDGKKAAQKALDKSSKAEKKSLGGYAKAKKSVAETSQKLVKTEAGFHKKVAHRSFMSAAKAAEAAANADKAFTEALNKADKKAKKETAEEAHKELKVEDEKARKMMANYETVKLKATQQKNAEALLAKEEKEENNAKIAKAKELKQDLALSKDALKGFGSPPK